MCKASPSVQPHASHTCAVQGDGNAFIFQKEQAVFTFSMHGEGNFPARKQNSDIDIPLPDGTSDDVYLRCGFQQKTGLCAWCDCVCLCWIGRSPSISDRHEKKQPSQTALVTTGWRADSPSL